MRIRDLLRVYAGRVVAAGMRRVFRSPAPYIIPDRISPDPYLSRWYPAGVRDVEDDRQTADLSPTGRRSWNPFIHFFHRGDGDNFLHSHPWMWGISLILSEGYIEERRETGPDGKHRVVTRVYLPFSINILRRKDFHRVTLIDPNRGCWTLFIAGPKVGSWHFWDPKTDRYAHWRDYLTWAVGDQTDVETWFHKKLEGLDASRQ